ncbi:MAG: type II secretion system secretin GspD [Gammaproteobacteria bacterium]|nr:type II secretion system secretin GspD [Gammaproteobacteria bacterium]
MNKYYLDQLYKTSLLFILAIVTGCSTTSGPDYEVTLNSSGEREIAGYVSGGGAISDETTSALDAPVIRYGKGGLFNRPTKRSYSNKKGSFSLDFVNISVEEFVSIVFSEMLGKNYSLDSTIKGNVTVQTRGEINASQLLSIVESVLASKNAVMVSLRNHFELIPISKAKNYSFKPELYSARNIKPGYRMVIIPVYYVNPADLKPILESVAPGAGHLKIDKERRAIVVTGSEREISNVVDAVQIFDVSWLESKSIALLPVKNAPASAIKKEIGKILTSQNKAHDIVLDTFERFNALLVVAQHKKEIEAVKSWLEILDIQVPTADTQLFVYEVQNRKAGELAEMLNGIFNEGAGDIADKKTGAVSQTASNKEVVVTNKKVVKATTTQKSHDTPLKIVADESNNAIIILAKEAEYKNIKAVIKNLDVLPLQVLIEVSIVEVTLTDELTYGLEWYLKHNGIADKYDADSTLDLNTGEGIGAIAPGFSVLLSGTGSLIQAVFNTLASESKLNVISSPSLMALDNHTATIRVGDQQPVQVASAKSTNNDVLTQSIEYKSTGVLLSVTPRVNAGGLVTMELSQEVTDIGGIDDATGQRSFLQRNINSTVAVQDGRTIVLGGLITENSANAESGVPGIHNWPIIGGLFGKTVSSKTKRELIVLITPRVIFNHENATQVTQEYAKKMELLKISLQDAE